MCADQNLISVRSDVAASLLIDGLFEEAERRQDDPLPADIELILASTAEPRIARLGYLARVIERERFERALVPMTWLSDALQGEGPGAVLSHAAALTAREPIGKPAPADGAPSWQVPGPGGHVRHFLALRAVGPGALEGKRSWMLGFFAACCREAWPSSGGDQAAVRR